MATGSGLATALAALKTHVAATAIIGTLVVGGSAATVAVATGAVHLPSHTTQQPTQAAATAAAHEAAQRAQACATNGDVARLAATYAPMFGNSRSTAQQDICTLFAGSGHEAEGLGQVQLILATAAAIERNGGNTACLTAAPAHGQPAGTGKPADPGKSADHGKPGTVGTPAAGETSTPASVPSAQASDTEAIIAAILKADPHGTPLAQLARACGATPATGNADDGQPTQTAGAEPTDTPGAEPTDTPGAEPTDTPGAEPTDTPGAEPTQTAGAEPTDTPGAEPTGTPGHP